MTSRLIISLDLELMWGVRDHASVAEYGDAIIGGRRVIPEILRLFACYKVRATWATVGLLMARTRSEMLDYSPDVFPEYDNQALSNNPARISELGKNEDEDPFHFGRSLVDRIGAEEGQEIASHTFSHFYCLEPGATPETFDANLKSARAIAESAGHCINSMVFPRNQYSEAYLSVCVANGITAYRGQPDAYGYRPLPKAGEGRFRRGVRLIDSVVPIVPRGSQQAAYKPGDAVDVKASHFFRPWRSLPPGLSALQLGRILREMRSAAIKGRDFHLWWHPHNFGRHPQENLFYLERLLQEFVRLRSQLGMQSMNMSDVSRSLNRGSRD